MKKAIRINSTQPHFERAQRGSVLPISLFILLVLTIIGATSLNDTVMEEKMSSNFQQGNIAFQAAESSVNRTFIKISSTADGTTLVNNAIDAWDASDDDTPPVWPTDNEFDLTPTGDDAVAATGSTVLTAEIQLNPTRTENLLGCTLSKGLSSTCSSVMIDVVATGTVAATNIQRTHVQGVKKPLPAGS